jgi:isoquinoline 1-oxidoreductase alpha subunit
MPEVKIKVNGKSHLVNVDLDTPLLWVLRDNLELTGTKYGCGIAQCGACTVHIDGQAVRSCVLPVSSVQFSDIVTIEGLSENCSHPVQLAWDALDVPQCGYCQSGQIMTAAAMMKNNPKASEDDITNTMVGNICRCGTYHRIKEAIDLAFKISK